MAQLVSGRQSRHKILGDDYRESTAKYAQLVRYTEGRKNKLDQAEYLANKVFDTLEAKAILHELVGDPDSASYTNAMNTPTDAVRGISGALTGAVNVVANAVGLGSS